METLLNKDRLKEINPYLFQKIESKIENNHSFVLPLWSLNILRLSILGLILLMGFNFYSFYSNSKTINDTTTEIASTKNLVEEYHFQAFSSLYPTELLNE